MLDHSIHYGEDSGFFVFRSKKLSLAMNLLGHQEYYWSINDLDPRLIGGVPFWLTYNKKSIIPSIPYYHGRYVSGPKKLPYGIKISRFINSLKKWRINKPYNSGFLSYLIHGTEYYIFQGFNNISLNETNSGILVSGKANLIRIKKYSLSTIKLFLKNFLSVIVKRPTNKIDIIRRSDIIINREYFINNEMMRIIDKYPKEIINFKIILFTLRTFDNVKEIFINDFICFISEENNTFIAVSINENEKVIKAKEVFSSTGKCLIWKFCDSNLSMKNSNNERILLFGDDINNIYKIKHKDTYFAEIRKEIEAKNENKY